MNLTESLDSVSLKPRERDGLCVLAVLIRHCPHPNRTALDHDAVNQRNWHDDDDVGQIAVAAQRPRHVALVARASSQRSGQHKVHEDRAGGLFELLLDRARVHRNFDDDVDLLRNIAAGTDVMKDHGDCLD